MKYLIIGETIDTKRNVTPNEFTNILERGIILNLYVYNKLGFKKKFKTNGNPEKSIGVAIVHGESIKGIKRLLAKVPSWFKVKWKVVPLEKA
jgi:hypothetical protein